MHTIVGEFIKANYPTSLFQFLFGSHATNTANDHSDIDLVIVLPEVVAPIRKRSFYQTYCFDLFIYDTESLHGAIHLGYQKADKSLIAALAEGIVLPQNMPIANALKHIAQEFQHRPLQRSALLSTKYQVSIQFAEFISCRPSLNRSSIALHLLNSCLKLLLINANLGISDGKHIPERINQYYPDLYPGLAQVYASIAVCDQNGGENVLSNFASKCLELSGGMNDLNADIRLKQLRIPLVIS